MDDKPKLNLKDGLSIDEAKVSVLIITCILAFIYMFIVYAIDGDISDNLTSIIQTLVLVIGGVNITNLITTKFNK